MASECSELLLPFGKNIRDATDHYVDLLKSTSKSCVVPEVVAELQADRHKLSERYLEDIENRLGRFAAVFPETMIAAVTKKDAKAWLESLNVGNTTFNNFRRLLVVLFNFAVERDYAATNPIEKIKPKADGADEAPAILTVHQMRVLLDAADIGTLPYYAIGGFAGLRPSETLRLDWSHVNLEEGLIKVVGRKGSRKRGAKIRFVKILPNLSKWLAPYQGSTGPVVPKKNWRKKEEAVRRAAGFGTPGTETVAEKKGR
jgi:integrase